MQHLPSPQKRVSLLITVIALIVSGCSNSSSGQNQSTDPFNDEIAQFIGTWTGCFFESTASSNRLTFVFDGTSAAVLSEAINVSGCFGDVPEPASASLITGELIFESPISDTALGFISYPITFINSDMSEADRTDIMYTDGNVLFFGEDGNVLDLDGRVAEQPVALSTLVSFEFRGPPEFDFSAQN